MSGRGEKEEPECVFVVPLTGVKKPCIHHGVVRRRRETEKTWRQQRFSSQTPENFQLQRPHTHCVVTESSVPQDGLADEGQVAGLLWETEKRRADGLVFHFKQVELGMISRDNSIEMNCSQELNVLASS